MSAQKVCSDFSEAARDIRPESDFDAAAAGAFAVAACELGPELRLPVKKTIAGNTRAERNKTSAGAGANPRAASQDRMTAARQRIRGPRAQMMHLIAEVCCHRILAHSAEALGTARGGARTRGRKVKGLALYRLSEAVN